MSKTAVVEGQESWTNWQVPKHKQKINGDKPDSPGT